MREPPQEVKLRLLFILHRGFVEARLLAAGSKAQQIFDLSDALELIPGMISNWEDKNLDQVRSMLENYQKKYSGGFDFLSRLADQSPLEF